MRESVHETTRGTLRLTETDTGLLFATVVGHYGVDLLPKYLGAMNHAAQSGHATGFHDWEAMETYDSQCRQAMTDWTIKNRRSIQGWHILVKSRLVAMGVSTASLLIGGGIIVSYTNRGEFEDARRGHLRRAASASS